MMNMNYGLEIVEGFTQKMGIITIIRDNITVTLLVAIISMGVLLCSSSLTILYATNSKSPIGNHQKNFGDMYMIRPTSSDDTYSYMQETTEVQQKAETKLSSKLGNSETEIRNYLIAAKDLTSQGKLEKADKVYQHVIALYPEHPDVLTAYGQFLEEGFKDVVKAEHLYVKALIAAPLHARAAERRRRTLPLVEEIDQRNFDRVSTKQQQLNKIDRRNSGLKRAKVEAYIQHIYHTNAMEGNTMNLAQTRAVVETGISVGGKSVFEHNEILGMDAALQHINKTLLHRSNYIGLKDILELHKRVLGFVNIEEAGRFRNTQVFVGSHRPPPPDELDLLVDEFVDWLNSEREDSSNALHPLELAALAHYKFVYIHPFYDGNGRVSRLIMNLVLMQAGYPPVIINVDDKHEYYQTLQMANDGDVRPFIRFVADCTERTLDHYLAAASSMPGQSVPGLVSRKDSRRSFTFTTAKTANGGKKIILSPPYETSDENLEESESLIVDVSYGIKDDIIDLDDHDDIMIDERGRN